MPEPIGDDQGYDLLKQKIRAERGFLVLGKVSMICGYSRSLFYPVRLRERLYRRSDSGDRASRSIHSHA